MNFHLISGGCGFVGRNMAKHLYKTTQDTIIVVDDLSVGMEPAQWPFPEGKFLGDAPQRSIDNVEFWGEDQRMIFWNGDFRLFLRNMLENDQWLKEAYGIEMEKFTDVFHFAAIVGGRAKIDGDPMMVALDLSIDAEFFYWACKHKPTRVMFPSSSAAYPVNLQAEEGFVALKESDIDFETGNLGQPDMTYGWSKLTGEYLARIAAEHYDLHVACVRPFSGYGEDQDLSYPIPAIASRAAGMEDPFEVWGTGKQGRDFVHIDDCIDAILFALDNIKDGSAMNIGSGKITSFLEIIELFTEFAGYKPEIKPLLHKPVGVHARHANMDHVFNELGWKPKISLREGMKRVYEQAVKNLEKTT
ncbi:NAD-dependent epimerase/dehydratase family protein [Pontibacter sp. G13]|uniref:NAD-dependent epimerase/dehydratase family protein n=1 Tax=Pontibacter sp. G13 TaxID=3074898 RepID=UPI00288B94B9|nr:NAD-dependent epimerase/dehydratase family protein [Pontibacter sp. G13]WNJ18205.1 NAD-dependent epimerase/dehydratase family protein [Pontibacter sp. G13]